MRRLLGLGAIFVFAFSLPADNKEKNPDDMVRVLLHGDEFCDRPSDGAAGAADGG